MKKFREGQRVILKADPDEGWPEQRGVVDGPSGKTTYIITVDKKYREDKYDDGLRECYYEDLEAE